MAFIEFNKRTGLYTYDEEMILQVEAFRRLEMEYGLRALHYLWLWCRKGSPVQYIKSPEEKDAFLVQTLNKMQGDRLGQKLPYQFFERPTMQFAINSYERLNLDAGSVEQVLYLNARDTLKELIEIRPKRPTGKNGQEPTPDEMEKYVKNVSLRNKALKENYIELKALTREMQDSTSGGIWAKGGTMFEEDPFELDDLLKEVNG